MATPRKVLPSINLVRCGSLSGTGLGLRFFMGLPRSRGCSKSSHSRSDTTGCKHLSGRSQVFALVCLVIAVCVGSAEDRAAAAPEGFQQYSDPQARFTFEYPATMQLHAVGQNEVKVLHPGATLRITVFLEERPHRSVPAAKVLLEAFKKKLQEEMKEPRILEEGALPGLKGSQGYIICTFKDRRELQLVQLVQYYVTEDRMLQMIISDRPEGFRNLQQVIRHIHQSLRITNPALK